MDDKINLDYFDVIQYLDSRGVLYDIEGENISAKGNWIGLQCLWCSDHLNHLGINLDTKGISCWMCPIKGTVLKLIMKIDRCGLKRAKEVVNDFSDITVYVKKRLEEQELDTDPKPPPTTQKDFPKLMITEEFLPLHRAWLEGRNFDPEEIYYEYGLKCCGAVGKYNLRLIVPFYERNRMVTFTTRDVTDKAKTPYIHLSDEKSIIAPKKTLYNIKTMEDTALVVEGVTDVWRMGKGCVGTMGIKYTTEQVYLLSRARRVFTLFDSGEEAQKLAERLAYDLGSSVDHVENLEISEGDPADLSQMDVDYIRRLVFGRAY